LNLRKNLDTILIIRSSLEEYFLNGEKCDYPEEGLGELEGGMNKTMATADADHALSVWPLCVKAFVLGFKRLQ
jgi:hypothetical protein